MGFFKAPQFGAPPNPANKTFDSISTSFRRPLSSADIATLKTTIEANFAGIAFNYSGKEFDYEVFLEGPESPYRKAMNYLFPKGRDDITIVPFETLP
jgi:hypothetical protein